MRMVFKEGRALIKNKKQRVGGKASFDEAMDWHVTENRSRRASSTSRKPWWCLEWRHAIRTSKGMFGDAETEGLQPVVQVRVVCRSVSLHAPTVSRSLLVQRCNHWIRPHGSRVGPLYLHVRLAQMLLQAGPLDNHGEGSPQGPSTIAATGAVDRDPSTKKHRGGSP